MGNAGGETDGIQYRATTNRHDVTSTVQVRDIEDLEDLLQQVDVVLDFLTTWYQLYLADSLYMVRARIRKSLHQREQFWLAVCHVLVQPELDPGRLVVGSLQQFSKHVAVSPEQVIGETQAVSKGNIEVDVDLVRIARHDNSSTGNRASSLLVDRLPDRKRGARLIPFQGVLRATRKAS